MFSLLPEEVIRYIAELDSQVWFPLVQIFKFLSNTNVNEMKRKFLLCSTISSDVKYDETVTYKYNKTFHDKGYKIVYYLPNNDLHTFDSPCILIHNKDPLNIWFKDNKIHRDNDEPAVTSNEGLIASIYMENIPLFNHIKRSFGDYYCLNTIKMWFKNNFPFRNDDLPCVIRGISGDYKEWRNKDGLLNRDNL